MFANKALFDFVILQSKDVIVFYWNFVIDQRKVPHNCEEEDKCFSKFLYK